MDLLRGIRWLLYSDGYTIKGVQRILRDNGVRFVKECWREDAEMTEKRQAAGMDIPNLAGEAAEQARRNIASGGRPGRQARKGEIAPTPSPEGDAAPSQHAVLSSLLRELEECRDLLKTAVETETGRRSTKKGRSSHSRGADA